MISRGELSGQVLRVLNKTGSYTGFYSPEKMNDAIQEAYDFVSVEMFLANEGWRSRIQFFDTESGQVTVELPQHISMIREVRYKHGEIWSPLVYNDRTDQASAGDSNGGGIRQYPASYRILDNALYFDPAIGEGGTDYLQVEYVSYPQWLTDDQDRIDDNFDRACVHFMKYKTASILAASAEKPVIPWANQESMWYDKMLTIVTKRVNKPTRIREFGE